MISRQKKLDLDEAAAGMVLSAAVLDGRGEVLLPSATALTEAMLTSLRRRGVDVIYVVNDDVSEADLKAERERVQRRLEVLFRKCGNSRACAALRTQITAYRLSETT